MRRWTLLLLLAAALGAHGSAPPSEADVVEIFLDGDACQAAPERVSVAVNDKDDANTAVKSGDRWIWRPTPALRFDLDKIRAYVRFDRHRTHYEKPKAFARHTLTFRFSTCIGDDVQDLAVRARDEKSLAVNLNVRYRRELDGSVTLSDAAADTRTIPAVWFMKETLNLQLAWSEKAPNVPGLLVSSPAGTQKPLFVVSVGRDGDKIIPNPDLWTNLEKGLSVPAILNAMERQQNARPGARWNDYARATEKEALQKAGLGTVLLTPK